MRVLAVDCGDHAALAADVAAVPGLHRPALCGNRGGESRDRAAPASAESRRRGLCRGLVRGRAAGVLEARPGACGVGAGTRVVVWAGPDRIHFARLSLFLRALDDDFLGYD